MLRSALACVAAIAAPTAWTAAAETRQEARALLVLAAASLTDALIAVLRRFTDQTGIAVKPSFAASSVLARQIEAGAPADLFISADREWMDYLGQRKLLRAGSRRDLLGNALVLIAPRHSAVHLALTAGADFTAALGGGRLATGDPDSVPVGRYARAALQSLGSWEQVVPHLVGAENVRAALALVARGEATLGIVYRTDAEAESRVRIVATFPPNTYPAIRYPLAVTAAAQPAAADLASFLSSAPARSIFKQYGFEPLT